MYREVQIKNQNPDKTTVHVPIVSLSSNVIGMVLSLHSIRNFILLEDGHRGIAFPTTSPTETEATDGTTED